MLTFTALWGTPLGLRIMVIVAENPDHARIILREVVANKLPAGYLTQLHPDDFNELLAERPDLGEQEGYFQAPGFRSAEPCVLRHAPFVSFYMRLHKLNLLINL